MRDEYIRLCVRESMLQVWRQRIEAELPIVKERTTALRKTLVAYDGEDANPSFTPESVIATQYPLGHPTDFIADLLNANFGLPDGEAWTPAAIDDAAELFDIERPKGWDEARADAEWAAACVDDDDWIDRAYGLPDAASLIDKVSPEPPAAPLLLAAPEPISFDAEKLRDELLDKIAGCKLEFDLRGLSRNREFQAGLELLRQHDPNCLRAVNLGMTERVTGIKREWRERHPHPKDPNFVPLKTPERVALLKELWETTRLTKLQMADRLNALPGIKMSPNYIARSITQWKVAASGAESARPLLPEIAHEKPHGPGPETGNNEPISPPERAQNITEITPETLEPTVITFGSSVSEESKALLTEAAKDGGFQVEDISKLTNPPPTTIPAISEPPIPKPTLSFIAPAPPPRIVREPPPAPPPNLGPPRLAKALELLPATAVSHEPIEADAATIRMTAETWGAVFRGEADLWAVNKAAEKRGARPFRLIEAPVKIKRRNCLSCGKSFDSKGPGNRLCAPCAPKTAAVME